jgi:hypothetical protein
MKYKKNLSNIFMLSFIRANADKFLRNKVQVSKSLSGHCHCHGIVVRAYDISINGPADGGRRKGLKVSEPLVTIGETIPGTTGALNSSTAGDYTPVGILDGLGA